MTILLITREAGEVICYSDSRVTNRPNNSLKTVTDHFSKILLIPFRLSMGRLNRPDVREVRGEFGFAFAGDITFATALYSMASSVFMGLHSNETDQAPKMTYFAETLARLANVLLDDVIVNAKEREYSIFFFGPCPRDADIKIFEILIDRTTQPWRFASIEVPIKETGLAVAGSGAPSFFAYVKKNPQTLALPYAEILLDLIESGEEPTIGGFLQQGVASSKGVRIVPMINPINGRKNLEIHVAGLSISEIGSVGDFTVGRDAIGFRILEVAETQWLLENGYSQDRRANSPTVNETAKVMANLRHWQSSEGKSAGLHYFVRFLSPKVIEESKYYFLARCDHCNRPCPVLEDPSFGAKPEPFFGNGGIIGTCCYCGSEVRVPVIRLRSRPGKHR